MSTNRTEREMRIICDTCWDLRRILRELAKRHDGIFECMDFFQRGLITDYELLECIVHIIQVENLHGKISEHI